MKNKKKRPAPYRVGYYPSHHGLWHLQESGLNIAPFIRTGKPPVKQWKDAQKRIADGGDPIRIVIIDTPVARDHPNLSDAFKGSYPIDMTIDAPDLFDVEFANTSKEKLEIIKKVAKNLAKVAAGTAKARKPNAKFKDKLLRNTSLRGFASHGTAMAGIIAARPSKATMFVRPQTREGDLLEAFATQYNLGANASTGVSHPTPTAKRPAKEFGPDGLKIYALAGEGETEQIDFPYSGADPTAQLFSIGFSALTKPYELLAALHIAQLLKADLIVMSVSIPVAAPHLAPCCRSVDNKCRESEHEMWSEFQSRLESISKKTPVLCAAGNSPDRVTYPASLAKNTNGIFAIGAVTSENQRLAAYSPEDGVTLFAYSGDSEVNNRDLHLVDPFSPIEGRPGGELEVDDDQDDGTLAATETDANDGDKTSRAGRKKQIAQEMILTTDAPGPYGYSLSPYRIGWLQVPKPATGKKGNAAVVDSEFALLDFASNFSAFNGTSAATALAAGLISLGFSTGALSGTDPVALKKKLSTGKTEALHWRHIDPPKPGE